MDTDILNRANKWLTGNYDEETKAQVRNLIDNDPNGLTEAFYRDLEFGTGGLRGIMGVGTNRMNKYTVGMATQGFANYLKDQFSHYSQPPTPNSQISVAIAFDSRNNSKYFAQISADVLSANGIKVYLYDDIRPTPVLSFTIRYLKCNAGIVITASHNPKEYNGYKVYWDDGGQLINPHDKNVIAEVLKINDISDIKFEGNKSLIKIIGSEIDAEYIKQVKTLSLLRTPNSKLQTDLKIVYTPLHGSGVNLVPMALKAFDFINVYEVKEQAIPDGNFPTLKSPNPEEQSALEMAIRDAKAQNADLVLATDPDADRVGIAVKDTNNEFVLLNGNQTATVLIYYLLTKWKENGKITGKEFIVKTIVTTELLKAMADKNKVECYDVLTGFKYIADIIKQLEGKKQFIGGGEESYGYLVGDFVRDKDAVISCCMISEAAVYASEHGKTFLELLKDIYIEFGLYKEKLLNIEKKGKSGAEEIQKMMENYRDNPPAQINGSKVVMIKDYLTKKTVDFTSGIIPHTSDLLLPSSDVLQFYLEDGTKISVRPSGTEPKIKFYFGVKEDLKNRNQYDAVNKTLDNKIQNIIKDLKLN